MLWALPNTRPIAAPAAACPSRRPLDLSITGGVLTSTATDIDALSATPALHGAVDQCLGGRCLVNIVASVGTSPSSAAPSFFFDTNTNTFTDLASTGMHTYSTTAIGFVDL